MTEILIASLLLIALVLALSALVAAARAVLVASGPVTVVVNGRLRIATRAGGTLLDGLNGNGVMIPSACAGAGTCGLCRVIVAAGGGDPLATETGRFTRAELAAGTRLACQVRLRGDVAVEVPDALIGAEPVTCRVAAARFLTPLIREVVLSFPEHARPEIPAGAYLQITAPPHRLSYDDIDVPPEHAPAWTAIRPLAGGSDEPVNRAYSVANRPADNMAGRAVLNIRLALPPPDVPEAPPGIVSGWLFSVGEGDEIEVSGPFGSFRARETGREMVLIGGGVGMAPLRAIVFDQLERVGADRRISFWYGARSRRELFYVEEFEDLARRHPNFTMTVALSDPGEADAWDGPTGFIHSVVWKDYLRDHPAPEDCEYYLCGPPLMVRAVLAMLDDAGVDPASIFNDDFGI